MEEVGWHSRHVVPPYTVHVFLNFSEAVPPPSSSCTVRWVGDKHVQPDVGVALCEEKNVAPAPPHDDGGVAMCIPPLFGQLSPAKVEQHISYHRRLGITRTFFYLMHPDAVQVRPFLNVTVLSLPWLNSVAMDNCSRRSQCTNAQNWQVNDCIHRSAAQGLAYALSIDLDEVVTLGSAPHLMALISSSAEEVLTLQSRQLGPGASKNGTLVCHEVPGIKARWLCTGHYGRRKHLVRTASIWLANIHWAERCKPPQCKGSHCRTRACLVRHLDAREDWLLHDYRRPGAVRAADKLAADGRVSSLVLPTPQSLPQHWWRPARVGPDPGVNESVVACPPKPGGLVLQMAGRFGRLANYLLELAALLEVAVSQQPAAAVLLSDEASRHYPTVALAAHLDVVAATQGWACVLTSMPPRRRLVRIPPEDVLKLHQTAIGALFHSTVLTHLLLHPTAALRAKVDSYVSSHFPSGFVGVHLRSMDSHAERCRGADSVAARCQVVDASDVSTDANASAVAGQDVCGMSDAYLEAALRQARMLGWPLFLAHDGEQPGRAREIIERFGATTYTGTHWRSHSRQASHRSVGTAHDARTDGNATDAWVDLLLLLRSNYLIGNPLSSWSTSLARVRAFLWGAESQADHLLSNIRSRCSVSSATSSVVLSADDGRLYVSQLRALMKHDIDK